MVLLKQENTRLFVSVYYQIPVPVIILLNSVKYVLRFHTLIMSKLQASSHILCFFFQQWQKSKCIRHELVCWLTKKAFCAHNQMGYIKSPFLNSGIFYWNLFRRTGRTVDKDRPLRENQQNYDFLQIHNSKTIDFIT